MTTEDKSRETKNAGGNDRKARLAEALRANLRRRREQTKRRGAQADALPEDEAAVNPPQSPPKRGE